VKREKKSRRSLLFYPLMGESSWYSRGFYMLKKDPKKRVKESTFFTPDAPFKGRYVASSLVEVVVPMLPQST